MPAATPPDPPPDPQALLRSRSYVQLLVLAALVGLPVSAASYGFLALVDWLQGALFDDLPTTLGLRRRADLVAAAAARRSAGCSPRWRSARSRAPAATRRPTASTPRGRCRPSSCPACFFAALATLAFGAVLGPEAPLIAMGSGLGVLAVRLAARDAPPTAAAVMAATGSFAAISSLLGSPLIGAFLLLEASGLGGPMLGLVLLPGLLAAGLGTLIFLGLDSITGLGTFTPRDPRAPAVRPPDRGGLRLCARLRAARAVPGPGDHAARARGAPARRAADGAPDARARAGDRRPGDRLRPGDRQAGVRGPVLGAVGAGRAWSTAPRAGRSARCCCSSLCKALAYALSLSSFRGGPVFPAMFIGAAAGIAASHLPGLALVPAVAMGIGAHVPP